jgi:hypothetical protein
MYAIAPVRSPLPLLTTTTLSTHLYIYLLVRRSHAPSAASERGDFGFDEAGYFGATVRCEHQQRGVDVVSQACIKDLFVDLNEQAAEMSIHRRTHCSRERLDCVQSSFEDVVVTGH